MRSTVERQPPNGLTVVDLFAGCGGISEGFRGAGFSPILGVEFERNAAATYEANFNCQVYPADIAGLIASSALNDLPKVDVVVGGPPCQGFSGLGHRNPEDPRNRLWSEYVRILQVIRPTAFLIENVPEFMRSPEYALLKVALQGELADYSIRSVVLDAADFGVPQRRKRAFVIGSLTGQPLKPVETHVASARPESGLPPWVTVDGAFKVAGIPLRPSATDLPDQQHVFDGVSYPGTFSGLEIHVDRNYEPTSIERYRRIAPGRGRFDLPDDLLFECWRKKRTGTTDVLGRLEGDKPSVTIRTEFFKPEKGRYLHPHWCGMHSEESENRAITHLEASVLQSFPTDFKWVGSKVQIAKQIGNAVPPRLAYEIAMSSVIPSINGINSPAGEDEPTTGIQMHLPNAS